MSYQTILVQLSHPNHADQLLEGATSLAKKQKAYLIGIYVIPQIVIPSPVAAEAWTSLVDIERERFVERSEQLQAQFEKACKAANVKSEWRSIDAVLSVADVVIKHALCADVVIMAQADPDDRDAKIQAEIVERVLIESGRPILVMPYAGHFKSIGDNALIAWTPAKESARAVFDALPLLQKAKRVKVMTVNPQDQNGQMVTSTATQCALSLARHGVKAEADHTSSGEISVGNELLSRAADFGADLLVMGGYGHSRFRETVFGGVTKEILHHMTMPVLMSH